MQSAKWKECSLKKAQTMVVTLVASLRGDSFRLEVPGIGRTKLRALVARLHVVLLSLYEHAG
jgi:hypothetical protein